MYRHIQDCQHSRTPPSQKSYNSFISLKTKIFKSKLQKKKKKKACGFAHSFTNLSRQWYQMCAVTDKHCGATTGKTNVVLHNTIKQYLLHICTQTYFYTFHCLKLIILMQVTALKEQFPRQHSFHHTPQSSLCPPWPSPAPHETQHHST